MRDLAGRRALVTGATGGLGRHITNELARAGVHLAISARNTSTLNKVADELRGLGREVQPFPADLARPRAADDLAAMVEETFGPLDILVNNAGVEIASSFTRYSTEELERILALDLLAPVQLIHRLLPGMLTRGAGHVVNICSLASKSPLPYGVPYAAAKWGLSGATASLRTEYANTGVGFSAVIPGFVTGAGIFARHEADGVAAPALLGTTTPEEVGRAVLNAIRRNAPEIIVTPRPVRPFFALAALAPRTAQRLTNWAGIPAISRQVARLNNRIGDPPTGNETIGSGPVRQRGPRTAG